jgi:phenylacetate-coenzyme A ligase PaaK-like adenylate-forming protein
VFETGVRQFRLAMSLVWGRRPDVANLARLVDDALATVAEFGEPGVGARELLDGPFSEPDERDAYADRSLRRTGRHLARHSAFYARRFASADIDPRRLDLASLASIPVTVKRDLIDRQLDFWCRDVPAQLATRTTGTTGHPAEVWMSRYELQLWSGMSALTNVLRNEAGPADLMQVHISSRATASAHLTAATCRLVGARCRILGVIPPEEALADLVGGVTLMSAAPSYLAELVVAARRLGLTAADFRLRRIDCGGEVLSPALKAAAAETFGARVNDSFGMTEVIPVTATTCSQGHLHHDLSMGLVELLDLRTGERAQPGALSTVVITPYHPYRECMPVLRYDTRDVVRKLDDQPLTCEIAGLPATSAILGKADSLLRLDAVQMITPRDLIEAVESLPTQPWPARYRAEVRDRRLHLTLPVAAVAGFGHAATRQHLAERGLDVELHLVPDGQARALRRVRSDLHETTFLSTPELLGDDHAAR